MIVLLYRIRKRIELQKNSKKTERLFPNAKERIELEADYAIISHSN